MAEKIYAKGIRTFDSKEDAPDFALGSLIIAPETLFKWIKEEAQEHLTDYKGEVQLRFNVVKSKSGKGISLSVSTYKPKAAKEPEMPF